jgi:hypothetical protein
MFFFYSIFKKMYGYQADIIKLGKPEAIAYEFGKKLLDR